MENIYDLRIDNIGTESTNFLVGKIKFSSSSNSAITINSDNLMEGTSNSFYSDNKVSANLDVIKGIEAYDRGDHNTKGYVTVDYLENVLSTSGYITADYIDTTLSTSGLVYYDEYSESTSYILDILDNKQNKRKIEYVNTTSFLCESGVFYLVDGTQAPVSAYLPPSTNNNSEYYIKIHKNTHKTTVYTESTSWIIPTLSGYLHIVDSENGYDIVEDCRDMGVGTIITTDRDFSDGDGFEHNYTYYIHPPTENDVILLTLPAPKYYDSHKTIKATFTLCCNGAYTVIRKDGGLIGGDYQITNTTIDSSISIEEFDGNYKLASDSRIKTEPNLSFPYYRLNETSGIAGYYSLSLSKEDIRYNSTSSYELVTPSITTTLPTNYINYIADEDVLIGDIPESVVTFVVETRLTLEPGQNDPFVYAYYEMYRREQSGLEFLLSRSSSFIIASHNFSQYTTEMTIPSTTFGLTDRLVMKVYVGKTISGGNNPTLTTKIEGFNGAYFRREVPSSLVKHNDLSGRSVNNAHTISSITGLQEILDEKISLSDFADVQNDPSGFENLTDSVIYMNDATRGFYIEPFSTDFSFYYRGVKYTKSSTETITITDTEGLHYIYYYNNALTETTIFNEDLILKETLVAIVYWDVTNKKSKLFDERHGHLMPSIVHAYLHKYERARYDSGLQPSGFTIGNGNDNLHAQYTISSGKIADEDILLDISNMSLTGSDKTIYYISDNKIRWIDNNSVPVLTTGTGRAAYNNSSGLVEVTNNNYVLYHTIALNNGEIGIFVGQHEYATIGDARIGIKTEASELQYGLLDTLTPEFVIISSVIYQTSTNYTNSVKSRIVEIESGVYFIDWRTTKITGITGINVSDHNLLPNLQGGSIDEYYHLSQNLYNNLQNYSASTSFIYSEIERVESLISSESTSSIGNTYSIQFDLPEEITNTDIYFYSFVKQSTASTLIRSGSGTGIANPDSATPIVCPCDGTIVSATLILKGAGVQNGSVTYPVVYQSVLHKQTFTGSGTTYNMNFSISNAYTVGIYSVTDTNYKGSNDSLNIAVSRGDLLALRFVNGTGASLVGQMKNAFVSIIIQEN